MTSFLWRYFVWCIILLPQTNRHNTLNKLFKKLDHNFKSLYVENTTAICGLSSQVHTWQFCILTVRLSFEWFACRVCIHRIKLTRKKIDKLSFGQFHREFLICHSYHLNLYPVSKSQSSIKSHDTKTVWKRGNATTVGTAALKMENYREKKYLCDDFNAIIGWDCFRMSGLWS